MTRGDEFETQDSREAGEFRGKVMEIGRFFEMDGEGVVASLSLLMLRMKYFHGPVGGKRAFKRGHRESRSRLKGEHVSRDTFLGDEAEAVARKREYHC